LIITGLIGYPLEKTLSIKMHGAAFNKLKIDGIYLRLPVKLENLKEATLGLRSLGFKGVNVTIPYKNKILKYLDDTVDEVNKIKAANTILIENEKLIGYNTDIYGFKKSLSEYNINIANKKVLLVGAGGVGHACAYVINSLKTKRFFVVNRTYEKAVNLSKRYNGDLVLFDKIGRVTPEIDIVINATSIDIQPIILPDIKQESIYYDINYKFKLTKKKGVKMINGLLMLVYQGAKSFEIWTNKDAPIEIMKKAVGFKDD
jgi:shikimate dehydrogenase